MHVNLSVAELGHPDLVADIRRELERSQLAAERLMLEITETQLLGDAKIVGFAQVYIGS